MLHLLTISISQLIIGTIALIAVVGILIAVGFDLGRRFQRDLAKSLGEIPDHDESPRVIVNVPADYKPLETLGDGQTIVGERAVLWYSVYSLAQGNDEIYHEDAIEAANEAVDKVFGSLPSQPVVSAHYYTEQKPQVNAQ